MMPMQSLAQPPSYIAQSPEGRHRGIKTERIFRILLNNPENTFTRYRIAKFAQAEQIQVSLLLRRLEKSHLVKGTYVADPKGLLTEWSHLPVKFESRSYLLKDILNVLQNTDLDYALTTYQAETMVNHYLFPSRTDLYIRVGDFDKWHDLLVSRRALVGGGNVRLRWYDDQVFYNSFLVNGYRLVSIPQIIVDLIREGGVTVQAAEMMTNNYYSLQQSSQMGIHQEEELARPIA
jgi:hypothetical protein